MKKSFWDVFVEELKNLKFDMLFRLLEEIRNELIMLKLNDQKYEKDICEYIDLEFIKQKIDNGLMTPEELLKYGDYFVTKISELHAASRDKTLNESWDQIKQDVMSGKLQNLETIIPVLLEFIFSKIQQIKDDIYGFVMMKDLISKNS